MFVGVYNNFASRRITSIFTLYKEAGISNQHVQISHRKRVRHLYVCACRLSKERRRRKVEIVLPAASKQSIQMSDAFPSFGPHRFIVRCENWNPKQKRSQTIAACIRRDWFIFTTYVNSIFYAILLEFLGKSWTIRIAGGPQTIQRECVLFTQHIFQFAAVVYGHNVWNTPRTREHMAPSSSLKLWYCFVAGFRRIECERNVITRLILFGRICVLELVCRRIWEIQHRLHSFICQSSCNRLHIQYLFCHLASAQDAVEIITHTGWLDPPLLDSTYLWAQRDQPSVLVTVSTHVANAIASASHRGSTGSICVKPNAVINHLIRILCCRPLRLYAVLTR